jgi:cytochrome c biogenesis protein
LKKVNILWSFFSSVKLTLVLLFLMVLLFIVATVVPRESIAPEFAWLADIHHSWLFYILTAVFSLNLMICSIDRWPVTMKQFKMTGIPVPSGLFENLPEKRVIFTEKNIEDAGRVVEAALSSAIGRIEKSDTGTGLLFYRQRGRFSLLGVYIVHLGVLIIIAGAVIGSMLGFKADMNLSEGEESSNAQLTGGKGAHRLDFSVRCDRFIMELYDTGAPKTYRSDLSFIKEGQMIHQASLLVNHPINVNGVRFYQSSYGLAEGGKAILTFKREGTESPEIPVKEGESFDLPVENAKASVLRVEENMMQMGPAVKLNIATGKGSIQLWVFQHIKEIAEANPGLLSEVPLFNPGLFQPLLFSLKRIERQYYTGLHVVRDPGVPFVLVGGLLLLAGILMAFFFTHQRIWVLVTSEAGGGTTICLAGRVNRYQDVLQRQIDDLGVKIRKELSA